MAATTSTTQLVQIRDKLLTAINKLAEEGVTSYSIGDQTFSLADVGNLISQVEKLDKLIALGPDARRARAQQDHDAKFQWLRKQKHRGASDSQRNNFGRRFADMMRSKILATGPTVAPVRSAARRSSCRITTATD